MIGWPLLVVLAALAAVAPVATDLYLPGFPQLGADLGIGASEVQLTLTTFLVGMAVGQLFMGPVSDRFGRRKPLLLSATACLIAGVVCALAPNLLILGAARLVQGLAGAGGVVIGRAVITDLETGRAAARAFTLMITVGGVAPVLAPLAGGLLSGPLGWRGLLWVVAALSALMLVGVVLVLPESHPSGSRTRPGSPASRAMATVLRTPGYRAPVAVFALSFAVMMAYISASSFVYQNVVGVTAVGYGVLFGLNAIGLVGCGWVASRLIDRVEPRVMVRRFITVQFAAAIALVVVVLTGAPTALIAVLVFVAVTANGGVMGNCAAMAMARVRAHAGTGSAILGFSQFALGALVSPLVGLGGADSAVATALVMATASSLGFAVSRLGLGRSAAAYYSDSTSMATS